MFRWDRPPSCTHQSPAPGASPPQLCVTLPLQPPPQHNTPMRLGHRGWISGSLPPSLYPLGAAGQHPTPPRSPGPGPTPAAPHTGLGGSGAASCSVPRGDSPAEAERSSPPCLTQVPPRHPPSPVSQKEAVSQGRERGEQGWGDRGRKLQCRERPVCWSLVGQEEGERRRPCRREEAKCPDNLPGTATVQLSEHSDRAWGSAGAAARQRVRDAQHQPGAERRALTSTHQHARLVPAGTQRATSQPCHSPPRAPAASTLPHDSSRETGVKRRE